MRCIMLFLVLALWGTGVTAQQDVCFRVDMRDALDREFFRPDKGDRVIVRGNFTGWVGNDLALRASDRDGIYSGVYMLSPDAGTEIEYKYVILKADSSVYWEWQPDPDNPPFGNRKTTLTGNAQNLPQGTFTLDRYDLAAVGMPVLFSQEELLEDFDRLQRRLLDSHCKLYAHITKDSLDALFTDMRARIDRPMSPREFFPIVEAVTGSLGCGHTSPWMSEAYWTYAADALFPLQFRLLDGKAVVTGYHGERRSVARGSVIESINGRPIQDIIDALTANYAADAFNPGFRLEQVQRRFPMLYARRYGFSSHFNVFCKLPGRNTAVRLSVPAADYQEVYADVFPERKPGLSVEEEEGLATIRIPTFGYYDRVEYFRSFMDSCFAVLQQKQVSRLILDLRGNDGGDPFCAACVLRHLTTAPLKYFASADDRYAQLAQPLPRAEHVFTGKLFVLIDACCFSTSAHFAALVKYHELGTIIGAEGGGNYQCNAYTDRCDLPNSRIMVFIPRKSVAVAVKDMDDAHGVQPDHVVEQGYRDFLYGMDTVMQYSRELAMKGN
ncbi:hypothetical protein KQI65_13525 [bacterium]|nr:hypothetical protein [bacterium]